MYTIPNAIELFGEEWCAVLNETLTDSNILPIILDKINTNRQKVVIYPESGSNQFFRAFRLTPPSNLKVVILGQDPYPDGSGTGLAFANTKNRIRRVSPSLLNILKEVNNFYRSNPHDVDYSLENWASQGVLLLNTAHTVVAHTPGSHLETWKLFTESVIQSIAWIKKPIVWLLMGNVAHDTFLNCLNDIDDEDYFYWKEQSVVSVPHPSPLNRRGGFIGSDCFLNINKKLISNNIEPIVW